jgi:MFS family permease
MNNVLILGVVSFFTDMASAMITVTFPLFLVYVLKNGVDKLGIVLAIATFVSYFFRVVFGYLSDKYSIRKPLVVSGYIISALSKPLFYFVHSYKEIALLRAVDRFAKAMRSSSKDALLSEYKVEKEKAFSFHKALDVAGEATGAFIAFLMFVILGANEETFRLIFLLTLIPGIFAVIFSFFIKDVKKEKEYKFDIKKDKSLIFHLILMTFSLIFVIGDSYFIVRANDNVKMEYIPLFIILLNLTQAIFSVPIGRLVRILGAKIVFVIALLFEIFAVIFLYYGILSAAFFFLGLFSVTFFNSLRIFIAKKAYNKASVFGVFYFMYALFGSIGALIIGYLWKNYGFSYAVIFSSMGLIAAVLINLIRTKNA